MDAVLDSVVIQHLVRSPRKKKRGKNPDKFETQIDIAIKQGRLRVCVDANRSLTSEWERTCSQEVIRVLETTWMEWGGIHIVTGMKKLPGSVSQQLARMNFRRAAVDKLILQIAMAMNACCVVSEDSDFWDPTDVKSVGDLNARVARYCRETLRIQILLLLHLLKRLGLSRVPGPRGKRRLRR